MSQIAPTQLPPQPWLTAPATLAVVAALEAGGGAVRFVGGCVRDALLGRPVKDLDLATHDPPAVVMEKLKVAGIHAIPTGIAHGTVTAVIGTEHFEITTLRVDVETDGRWAKVAFTNNWAEDAARRDFTINAISAEPNGRLHDPFGGLDDLSRGRVRFVGDARARIREDVLRLLRFFRFQAHYGRSPPDGEALAACRELAPLLPGLSGERVAGELIKLMVAADPSPTVALMIEAGALDYWLPETQHLDALRRLPQLEGASGLAAEPLRRLAALIAADAPGIDRLAERLRLSGEQRRRLKALTAPPLTPAPGDSLTHWRRLLRRLGQTDYLDCTVVTWAKAGLDPGPPLPSIQALTQTPIPSFPLLGRDALRLGVAPGPEVGLLLEAVEAWWEAGDYRADREACLVELHRRLEDNRNGRAISRIGGSLPG